MEATDREIRSMDKASAQRIVSGQAVVDLPSAVKELLDNALDSQGKRINIRLFGNGLDIVEVSDDGCGVPQASRPLLATHNATSKLESFDTLYSSHAQLGFRGQALAALANLSTKLVLSTRTAQDPLAERMEFLFDGTLDDATGVQELPRKVGTTVAVVGLLARLPVRRAQMQRNIASQRQQLIRLVQEYAVLMVGTQIQLFDMLPDNHGNLREHSLVATTMSKHIKESVSAVLGSKCLAQLNEIDLDLSNDMPKTAPDEGDVDPIDNKGHSECNGMPRVSTKEGKSSEDDLSRSTPSVYSLSLTETHRLYKIQGLVSKLSIGNDGSSASRIVQYFAINGRPVQLPGLVRILNESWRSLQSSSSAPSRCKRPCLVLHLTLPNDAFDINLSPDKRQVMLPDEKELLSSIRDSLVKQWQEQVQGHFVAAKEIGSREAIAARIQELRKQGTVTKSSIDYESDAEEEMPDAYPPMKSELESPGRFARRYAFSHDFSKAKLQHEYDDGRIMRDNDEEGTAQVPSVSTSVNGPQRETHVEPNQAPKETSKERSRVSTSKASPRLPDFTVTTKESKVEPCRSTNAVTPSPAHMQGDCAADIPKDINQSLTKFSASSSRPMSTSRPEERKSIAEQRIWHSAQRNFNSSDGMGQRSNSFSSAASETLSEADKDEARSGTRTLDEFGFKATAVMKQVKIRANSDDIEAPSQNNSKKRSGPRQNISAFESRGDESDEFVLTTPRLSKEIRTESLVEWHSFRGTQDVLSAHQRHRLTMRDRKRAFEEISSDADCLLTGIQKDGVQSSVSLSKEALKHMTVIGQFNLGFIVAKSSDHQLWILDQHACDEKYNFEKLCKDTIIHEQPLIAPLPLELSFSEEMCVLDNMDTFEANGFRFRHDVDKPPRHRLSLTAIPHSGARDGRKAVQFGPEDVSAMCSILGVDSDDSYADGNRGGTGTDGSGVYGNNAVRRYAGSGTGDSTDRILARVPKAIAMFASRACRGSIMIGKALSKPEMDRIVSRLADLQHPWNCPHGRPTMQHIGDIKPLVREEHNPSNY